MNIDQAKAIALPDILRKLGHAPIRTRGSNLWYLSPLREEKTASFHVSTAHNLWYDFGIDKGGDIITFAQEYLRIGRSNVGIADALAWLAQQQGVMPVPRPKPIVNPAPEQSEAPTLSLQHIIDIKHPALVHYLTTRRIPMELARRYFKQASVHNAATRKTFSAISFANEDGGHELRNQFFKGCIAPKRVSFIRGAKSPSRIIHVFEGCIDFVSFLVLARRIIPADDTIVLNSLSCLRYAVPYIRNYSYTNMYAWLDNDKAGDTATQSLRDLAAEENIAFRDMRPIYQPHKDVNDYLMHRKAR